MYRMFKFAIASIAIILPLSFTSMAKALRVALPADIPAQLQAQTAEVVVVGKVVEIEKEPTKAMPFPGAAEKVEYQIAVVKIDDAILGGKGVTTLRIGFQTNGGGVAPPLSTQPNIRPAIARIPGPVVALTAGQEGCFFVSKHPDGDFYVMQQFAQPLNKSAPDYDKQLTTVKKTLKIFEDPKSALKAKEAADRAFAANLLLQRYRSFTSKPNAKLVKEPIDAEESKLILTAMSELKWNQPDANGVTLQGTFSQLGLLPADGYAQPKLIKGQDFNKNLETAATKWLADNKDKYVIKRNVMK